MAVNLIALVIQIRDELPSLVEILCDETEIYDLELAIRNQSPHPLDAIHLKRNSLLKQELEFEDFVENLLSQPFLDPEIQKQGVDFLNSKAKLQAHRESEREAALIIADYAFRIYRSSPDHTDFVLKGRVNGVRVRVLEIG